MKRALVILSGGQDSTTCAALACQQFDEVHAITFNYRQRHQVELESAKSVAEALNLTSHEIIDLGPVLKGSSPLVSKEALGQYKKIEDLPTGVEPTFIPGRNILFLSIASNRAAYLQTNDIFMGLCQEDFAGYWDCRQSFADAMAIAISEGIFGVPDKIRIHTPLMNLTKAQIVLLAFEVLGEKFSVIFSLTHTCYGGMRGGCGTCHSCHLRDQGFREAGIPDPIWHFHQEAIAVW